MSLTFAPNPCPQVSLLRMTDRQSARQGLCAACMRAPIVREQTPAVKGGMALQELAAAYARTKLEEARSACGRAD